MTLNNPTEEELKHVEEFQTGNIVRGIMADEVGESGTPHIQGYLNLKNGMTMSAMKKMLGSNRWHLEKARGTDYEGYMYCKKEDSIVRRTWGEEPNIEGELSDWEKISQMVKDGKSNLEIIEQYPSIAIRCQAALDRMRLEFDRQNMGWRDLNVTFITGPTGCGKTRTVMENYGYSNVYRVTDKKHPFETYTGQDVIIFEEFRGSPFRIEDMLNYLDGYPLELPARYANKVAKYTQVYILTNIQFEELYPNIQMKHRETWDAFCRRIHNQINMWD